MWCECTLDRKNDLVNDYLSLFGVFMITEKGGSAQILERLMSSYGVNTQKDLAAALTIPANNISGWTQRDSIPGNAIIKCALDTGADLQWLVTGELAKANTGRNTTLGRGKHLHDAIMANGGKPVLRRIMDAYGFKTQKELGDYLNISSGTISTWIRRAYFPGDIVICCALDTGVSLGWLSAGKGSQFEKSLEQDTIKNIEKKRLNLGCLEDAGFWFADINFLSYKPNSAIFIESSNLCWLVDVGIKAISNGRWLLGIDEKYDVYDVSLLPGNKLSVKNTSSDFVCGVQEVLAKGKVIFTLEVKI